MNSHNEWDPLEEVIVGSVQGACFPEFDLINANIFPPGELENVRAVFGDGGAPYPSELVDAAQRDLDALIAILEREGVTVRRPDEVDYARTFSTPQWQVRSGFCAANPRDPFLVIGDEIIETPMADRSRYFEGFAYRSLFKDYFKAGARWTSAPKPELLDDLYVQDYEPCEYGAEDMQFSLTEFEPVFDAADFLRCGTDIIGQRSHVTNALGIEWLRRHLGKDYRVHELQTGYPRAMHIDTTLALLGPGRLMYNPEWLTEEKLRPIFKGWELLPAPYPVQGSYKKHECDVVSLWANMNVLMLDSKRVLVEAQQKPTIEALRSWGLEPIPCPFENYYQFMGGFHCATLDVRRRGELQSYL